MAYYASGIFFPIRSRNLFFFFFFFWSLIFAVARSPYDAIFALWMKYGIEIVIVVDIYIRQICRR